MVARARQFVGLGLVVVGGKMVRKRAPRSQEPKPRRTMSGLRMVLRSLGGMNVKDLGR